MDNGELEARLTQLEERLRAQGLALRATMWTVARSDKSTADRIRRYLSLIADRLSEVGQSAGPIGPAIDELRRLESALTESLEARPEKRLKQG